MGDSNIRQQFFPMQLPAGVEGRSVDLDTAFTINAETQIFNPSALHLYEIPEARQDAARRLAGRFNRSGSEAVGFYSAENQTVGWFWGYMEDRETFCIDTFGLVTTFRGLGIYSTFVQALLRYLAALDFERVTVHTHVNNRAMLIANLNAGFSIMGIELSESTGALVKLIYHLYDDRRQDFARAFRLLPDEPIR